MLYVIKNDLITLSVSTHGAEVKKLTYCGIDRLHDSNPEYWNRSAPLLFPCVGTITNKQTIINNQSYQLPKHGFIRDVDFILQNKTENSLTFSFTSNSETKKIYPFDFEMIVTYQIIENKVLSDIHIKNLSNEVMPFNFGLHPAFLAPISEDESWNDYELFTESLKDWPIYKVELSNGTINFNEIVKYVNFKNPLPLNHEDYSGDALVFDNIDFNYLTLSNKKHTHGIKFLFEGFPMLGIWTPYPKKAPFICIEPWIGCADPTNHDGEFEHKPHIIHLEAQKEKTIHYEWHLF